MRLNIGGVDMPAPSKYDVTLQDLDAPSSGRTETGHMNRKRVRANVAKISLGWTNLTKQELETIVSAISPASFSVGYYFGGYRTANMYAGDRSCKLKLIKSESGTITEERWDLSFNLVEV